MRRHNNVFALSLAALILGSFILVRNGGNVHFEFGEFFIFSMEVAQRLHDASPPY